MSYDVIGLFERHCSNIKKTGSGQLIACCPFHDDKNPSFSFNDEGLYNCHACGAKGNAVDFAKHFGEDPKPFYSKDSKLNGGNSEVKPSINGGKTTASSFDKQKYLTLLAEKYWKNLVNKAEYDTFASMLLLGKDELGVKTYPYFDDEDRVIGIKHHKSYWEGDGSLKWYGANRIHLFNEDEPIYICEGEPDTIRLGRTGANVLCSSGGAMSVPKSLPEFKKFGVIIVFDKDKAGRDGALKCANEIYQELELICEIAQWREGLPDKFDISDDNDWKEFEFAVDNRKPFEPILESDVQIKKGYKIVRLVDAFEMDIQKPEMIVEDILNERGNTLLSAEDNVGKSMMANQLGLCIATGTDFLNYRVPKPRKVLLIQHEMENGEQIDRLKKQSSSQYKLNPDLFEKNVKLHLIEDGENLAIVDQFMVLDNTLIENPDIDVVVFDNIGQSTNVEMTKPDTIRNELKRLKALCRIHSVAFVLIAHHVKIDWSKEMDLTKRQIQGGKPITDWADNIIQLHTSSMNPNLVLFKITKIRSIHNNEGHSTKLLNQAVWFNQDNDLLFTKRFAVSNWEGHFTALDKHERELDFVKELNEYPQPFETNDALNVGDKIGISISTVKSYWLPKLCKWGWLKKEGYGKYSVNRETLDFLTSETLNSCTLRQKSTRIQQ